MSLRQKIAQGVAWTTMQNVGMQAISLGVFFLLARLLHPEAFGLVALAVVFIDFVALFLSYGLPEAIVQRHTLDQEHLDTAFWVILGAGIVLTLLGIASAGPVAALFKQPQLKSIIRWLSLSFFLRSLSQVQVAILRRQLALKIIATRSMVAGFVGGATAVIMALLGFGVWSLVGRQLIIELVSVLILWPACNWWPGLKFSIRHGKELFGFGVSMMGGNILNFFNRRTDDFLIGYFLGPVALGYYTVAYRLLLIMTQLWGQIVGSVAFPAFSRVQKELERLREMFYSATRLTSLVAFPAFLGIFALVPELVPTLFGQQWAPSIPVMQVLTFIGLLHAVLFFQYTVMAGVGKPSWYLGLQVMITVANVIGFLIAVRWGIVAVAISYVIVAYLFAPLSVWLVYRLIEIDLLRYLRLFLPAATGSLVMLAFIFSLKLSLTNLVPLQFLLTGCIVMSALAYAVTIRLVAPSLAYQAIDLLRSTLQGIKKEES